MQEIPQLVMIGSPSGAKSRPVIPELTIGGVFDGDSRWFHWRVRSRQPVRQVLINSGSGIIAPTSFSQVTPVLRLNPKEERWSYPVVSPVGPSLISVDLGVESSDFELAHSLPYPSSRLERFRHLRVCGGRTRNGHIEPSVFSVGSADPGRRVVWIICRQHPLETLSSYLGEFILELSVQPDPAAPIEWNFVIVANPSGCMLGTSRYNFQGMDMNRHWGLGGAPLETTWIWKRMEERGCDLILDIHGDETMPEPYLHLAADTLSPRSEAAATERRFQRCLRESSEQTRYVAYEDKEAPLGTPGLSIYALHRRHGCAGIILEVPLSRDRDSERDWLETQGCLRELALEVRGAVLACLQE